MELSVVTDFDALYENKQMVNGPQRRQRFSETSYKPNWIIWVEQERSVEPLKWEPPWKTAGPRQPLKTVCGNLLRSFRPSPVHVWNIKETFLCLTWSLCKRRGKQSTVQTSQSDCKIAIKVRASKMTFYYTVARFLPKPYILRQSSVTIMMLTVCSAQFYSKRTFFKAAVAKTSLQRYQVYRSPPIQPNAMGCYGVMAEVSISFHSRRSL